MKTTDLTLQKKNVKKTNSDNLDTRERIAHEATCLFAHQGYDGTSLRDIVEACQITKPVIYYYFQSKENLFTMLIHEAYDFLLTSVEDIVDGSGSFEERLKQVTHFYFEGSSSNEDTVRLIYHTAFGPRGKIPPVDINQLEEKHFALLARLFDEGIEAGLIRKIETMSAVMHYLGTITIYVQMMLLNPSQVPDHVEEVTLDSVLNGIGGQKK